MATKADIDAMAPTSCNCSAVRQAARRITQLYDQRLAPSGLRTTQYAILSRLDRFGPLTMGRLADAVVMDRTTLARAIKPLARDGLLAVEAGEDGRTRGLRLTSRGKSRLKAATVHWRQAQDEFEAAFGAGAAEGLRDTLQRLVAVIQER